MKCSQAVWPRSGGSPGPCPTKAVVMIDEQGYCLRHLRRRLPRLKLLRPAIRVGNIVLQEV